MADFSVIIIENGFPSSIPGFLDNTPVSTFPFWGNFTFFDFSLINFFCESCVEINVVIDKKYKKIAPILATRWKNELSNIIILENEIKTFLSFIRQIQTKHIIICSLLHIALFRPEQLTGTMENHLNDVIKISVDNNPLDFYFIKKKILVNHFETLAKEETEEKNINDILFKDFLENNFNYMIDIPGTVFFNNKIMQLYEGNLWLIRNIKNRIFLDFLARIPFSLFNGKESFISEQGHIKDSFISSGVEIEGYVENSILFPNVIVKKKSTIVNSVIMNNNTIGRNSHIRNTIILPFYEENTANIYNISDNSTIGGKSSILKNKDFPDHIYNGLVVIGTNTSLPRGFIIEQSTYLGPQIPLKQLKELKSLKKGVSLYIKNIEKDLK